MSQIIDPRTMGPRHYHELLRYGCTNAWHMDEAATAARVDEVSGVSMAESGLGDVAGGTGKIGTGAVWSSGDVKLTTSDASTDAYLSPGSADFSTSCWIYSTDWSTANFVMGVWGAAGTREWRLEHRDTPIRLQFIVSSDGTASTAEAEWGSALVNSTWYFVACKIDTTANVIGVKALKAADGSFLDESWVTTAFAVAVFQAGEEFSMGAWGNDASFFDPGTIDCVTVHNRVLEDHEFEMLFNRGSGREYPFL